MDHTHHTMYVYVLSNHSCQLLTHRASVNNAQNTEIGLIKLQLCQVFKFLNRIVRSSKRKDDMVNTVYRNWAETSQEVFVQPPNLLTDGIVDGSGPDSGPHPHQQLQVRRDCRTDQVCNKTLLFDAIGNCCILCVTFNGHSFAPLQS